MKSLKRYIPMLFVFVLCITLMFGTKTTVYAAATRPDSIQLGSGVDITDPMYNVNGTNFAIKYFADGSLGYCMNWDRHIPNNQALSLSRELDGGFAYIMRNGNQTADGTANYFITQVAIWWYMDDTQGTNYLSAEYKSGAENGSWFDNIVNLKDEAKRHQTYAAPSMSVNIGDTKMKLDSNKKNFVSELVTVNTSSVAGNYTVSLENAPAGAVVVNEGGNAQNSFAQGSKFKVMVPTSSFSTQMIQTMKVKVNATGSVDKAYEYSPADPGYYQHVVPTTLYPETSDLSKEINLKATATKVHITKLDITNGKELPGATLTVRDRNGKLIDQWISTKDVHVLENLEAGTYTLTETMSPHGYILSSSTISFTVKEDGKVLSVSMSNTPNMVKISKQDITNEKELPGATLVITDKDGKEIERWISTDKPYIINKMPAGKYTLTEEIAPAGYVLSKEKVEFEVTTKDEIVSVVMKNIPETPVPMTQSGMIILYIVGGLALLGGSGMIFYNVKTRKN